MGITKSWNGSSSTTMDGRRDNITQMPFDVNAWSVFCDALISLAEQFKKEHPSGVTAVVGHSVGGLLAMHVAMERPQVFDRVLVMNPALGPPIGLMYPLEAFGRHWRLSNDMFGQPCESLRSHKNYCGGYCQFKFGNIGSLWAAAKRLYCDAWAISRCTLAQWQYDRASHERTKRTMADLKSFQMVATAKDMAVQEKRIFRFWDKMETERPQSANTGLCMWPAEMTHSYLDPGSERKEGLWWKNISMEAIMTYLTHGKTIDVVVRRGTPNMRSSLRGDFCIPTERDGVVGVALSILPAIQRDAYSVADAHGNMHAVTVLFQGRVLKQTELVGAFNFREVELLSVLQQIVLVTRLERNAGIRQMFWVTALVEKDAQCGKLALAKMFRARSLVTQLQQVQPQSSLVLRFCSSEFVMSVSEEHFSK